MKIAYNFKMIFVLFISLSTALSCSEAEKKENNDNKNNNKVEFQNEEKVFAKAIKLETGWGYDIYMNKKRYIHQYLIPSISGVHTFSSKEKALKTGNFVVEKIQKGIIPPFVTKKELDSLNVLPEGIEIN